MKIIAISVFISLLLFAAFSCKNNPIIPPPPNDELDSTSHNIVWQIDTIGTWQSVLWDVWGTDPNNVYAAGDIFTSNDGREGTNIMHWDGKQWNPEPFWEGEITAIYGFSKNDVWVAGAYIADPFFYPLFGHWNGSKWEKTVLSISGVIGALWGTSPTNLYAVGSGGMILHYDGSYWTQMNSGTNIRALSDIWGFSDNAIYASGYDASSGRGVLLYYNGTTWKTLIDKIYNYGDSTNSPAGQIPSVWGYDDSHLYDMDPSGNFFLE